MIKKYDAGPSDNAATIGRWPTCKLSTTERQTGPSRSMRVRATLDPRPGGLVALGRFRAKPSVGARKHATAFRCSWPGDR
jgi:hypothetical protein